MTWDSITLYRWECDGCGREVDKADDDTQPEGWVHGMDGLDRCRSCFEAA